RSPRRITDASLHTLLAGSPDTRPPPSALFWKLWQKGEQSAEAAYKTEFLQQLQGGVLSPDTYGAFLVSDLWYCYNGATSYKLVVGRTEDQHLKEYLATKRDSYNRFVEGFQTRWRINEPAAIIPTEAARKYATLERNVATSEHPIYTLIVMLPCEHLWAWLGEKMKDHVDDNVYGAWIKGNQGFKGAYKIGNFLHAFQQSHPDKIDVDKAFDVYTRAMQAEQENFGSP
ncbi:unnamed protein product, partial [Ectocarpus sp. 12 AP-2014]